jgi:hypothetical protein
MQSRIDESRQSHKTSGRRLTNCIDHGQLDVPEPGGASGFIVATFRVVWDLVEEKSGSSY